LCGIFNKYLLSLRLFGFRLFLNLDVSESILGVELGRPEILIFKDFGLKKGCMPINTQLKNFF